MTAPLPNVVRRMRSLARPALGDPLLLRAFLGSRDEDAFAELVRRHSPMMLSVCRRHSQAKLSTSSDEGLALPARLARRTV